MAEAKIVDWAGIELHYRAGKRSLEDIGKEYGVTKGRISQVAKKGGWERDLKAKIDAKAKAKVEREVASEKAKQDALNNPAIRAVKRLGESAIVEANSDVIAGAEMRQRQGMKVGMDVSYSLLLELHTLCNPRFAEMLEAIADAYDESGPGPNGAWKTDKVNEAYRYIISIGGRAKTAKDIAASHVAYTTSERKVLRMDEESGKGETTVDALLAGVLASGK